MTWTPRSPRERRAIPPPESHSPDRPRRGRTDDLEARIDRLEAFVFGPMQMHTLGGRLEIVTRTPDGRATYAVTLTPAPAPYLDASID